MNSTLNINKVAQADSPIVWLSASGRLDAGTIAQMERAFTESLIGGARALVVDLSELSYISSSGLRTLLSAKKKAHERNGDLVIYGLKGTVRDVFDMVGFSAVLIIRDSKENAMQTASAIVSKPVT